LEWRNNPSAREFSRNLELIRTEEHLTWLSERLGEIRFQPFYIFELGHKPVGMSRLDFESDNKFAISILVDPEHHGKGIGTIILNMTCEIFFDLYPSCAIVATVHQSNFISQKLFVKADFELRYLEGEFLHFEKIL
jgi:RimJ/RimL family protein N-acetyltransferase